MRQNMPHRNNIVLRPGKCKDFLNHPVRNAGDCGKYITLALGDRAFPAARCRNKFISTNSLHKNLCAGRIPASAKLECQICKISGPSGLI